MKNIMLISKNEERLILDKHISYGYKTFIIEQGGKQLIAGFTGDAKAFAKAKPGLSAAFVDVLKFAKNDKNQIVGHTKSSPNKAVIISNVDDLLYALRTPGAMSNTVLASFNQGLLKSAKTPIDLIDGITKEVVGSKPFISKYGKMTNSEMTNALKTAGYSDNAINSLITNAKKNPDFKKAYIKGVAKRKNKKTVGGKNKNMNPSGNGQNVPPPQRKTLMEKTKELINNINVKKMTWKQLLAWGAAIGVGGLAIWWFLFDNDDVLIPDDTPENEPVESGWAPCIEKLIKSGKGSTRETPNGDIFVIAVTDQYPKGLQFYNNGKVKDVSTNRMGTWKCGTKIKTYP